MGASTRSYPEGFRLWLRCSVTKRKVRATSLQKVSTNRFTSSTDSRRSRRRESLYFSQIRLVSFMR